ncbi:MAG: hypothetical protein CME93_05220 [Hyphomonadaceae bacterium]|nr:hypothetical protein [Hyphomonadaceae bacterium]
MCISPDARLRAIGCLVCLLVDKRSIIVGDIGRCDLRNRAAKPMADQCCHYRIESSSIVLAGLGVSEICPDILNPAACRWRAEKFRFIA